MSLPAEFGAPEQLRLYRVEVPLLVPYRWAGGTTVVRDVMLVRWDRPDGSTGWGECPTLEGYVTGGTEEAWNATCSIASQVADGGAQLGAAGEWSGLPDSVGSAARGALADAALDAALRSTGTTLISALGAAGSPASRTAVIGGPADTVEQRVASARSAAVQGAAMVKLKIDGALATAHNRSAVSAVMDSLQEFGGLPVAADANGTLDPDQCEALDSMGLAYLEQPFSAEMSWEASAQWCNRLVTPVALDEPIGSLAQLLEALGAGAADVWSIKAARLGGIAAAAEAIDAVANSGGSCFVGGMVELGVHRAGSAALASRVGELGGSLPTDVGPSNRYFSDDVCQEVATNSGGELVVPGGLGIGVEIIAEHLERFTVATWTSES